MPDTKHYVYSARTTEEGLAPPNKIRADRQISWDMLVNTAVCDHYHLDPVVINLPPSKYLAEREEKRKAREAEKVAKAKAKASGEKAKKSSKKVTTEASKNDEKK